MVQKVEEKNMKPNLKNITAVSLLSLALGAPFAMAQDKMSCTGPLPSEKEVKSLIVNAKTAADHQKLACYYRAEARDEDAKAQYHEEMGKLYAKSSNPKHDMAKHCAQFAKEARMAAKADNELAAEHEAMAAQAK